MDTLETHKISTSALARSLEIPAHALFKKLEQAGWIERSDDSWALTDQGKAEGGEYTTHVKYGTYIVWPEMVAIGTRHDKPEKPIDDEHLTATTLGDYAGLSPRQVNRMLAELGWIRRSGKGWVVTEPGAKAGGQQHENPHNDSHWVCWPKAILEKPAVISSIKEVRADLSHAIGLDQQAGSEISQYRKAFPARLRAADGHLVRSKTELMIDNWLYLAGIAHAYERKLPVDRQLFAEFYLPQGNVYLEYLGQPSDGDYRQRKEAKLELYQQYGLNVITLEEEQVRQLDVHLPRLLLKYGIRIY